MAVCAKCSGLRLGSASEKLYKIMADFEDLRKTPGFDPIKHAPPATDLNGLLLNTDELYSPDEKCILCWLFAQHHDVMHPAGARAELRAFPVYHHWNYFWPGEFGHLKNYMDFFLGAYEPQVQSPRAVVLSSLHHKPQLLRPRPIDPRFDAGRVRSWINTCKTHHRNSCFPDTSNFSAPSLRLIDCERGTLVWTASITPTPQFVALSYVWSLAKDVDEEQKEQQELLAGEIRKLPASLPGIIRDAMTVTRSLGYRYLWADRLCIDQSNRDEQASEILKMDLIYKEADLTVFSVSERNGLPGVGVPRQPQSLVTLPDYCVYSTSASPGQEISSSLWASRGWCYQEQVLSRRHLYFCESQVIFLCARMGCFDAIVGPEEDFTKADLDVYERVVRMNLSPANEHLFSVGKVSLPNIPRIPLVESAAQDPAWLFRYIMALLEDYTARHISYDTDSLNAILGVVKALTRRYPMVSFCQGLPFVCASASLAETFLLKSLCWFHADPSTVRRRPNFPSWSWDGWAGPACWPWREGMWGDRHEEMQMTGQAHFLDIRGDCGHSVTLQEVAGGTSTECLRHGCPTFEPKRLCIKAYVLPADRVVLAKDGSSDWSSLCLLQNEGRKPMELVLDYDLTHLTFPAKPLDTTVDNFLQSIRSGKMDCVFLGNQTISSFYNEVYILIVVYDEPSQGHRFGLLIFTYTQPNTPSDNVAWCASFRQEMDLKKKKIWLH